MMKHYHLFLFLIFTCLSTLLLAQQWEQITPAQSNPLFESPFYWSKMAVIDADTVWFTDELGRVTLTKDGGKTWDTNPIQGWEELSYEYFLRSLYAADANRAFLVRSSNDGESLILRTRDGGKTWDDAFKKGEFSQVSSYFIGIHFFNRQNGLAWGDVDRDTLEFYRTIDAGDSWQRLAVPKLLPGEIMLEAVGTFGDTIWVGTSLGRLLKSQNQGQTWTVTALPIKEYVASIALTNGHEAAVCLTNGRILYTTNGGNSWKVNHERRSSNFASFRIHSVPGQSGRFVFSNQFSGWADVSFDSCKTWPISILQPGSQGIWDLRFLNNQQAWAVQGDSVILKWKNPAVLFDVTLPDYTAIKSQHATGIQNSGAKIALWSGVPGNYSLKHTLLKDGFETATSTNLIALSNRVIGSTKFNAPLSGKGNYTYRTTLLQGNTTLQQLDASLMVGDSLFSKDNGNYLYGQGSNLGHFFDLSVEDQLTSIAATILQFESTNVQFWVFGYDPATKNYSKQLHYSSPIFLEPRDTLIVIGNDTFLFPLGLGEINYRLPEPLKLSKGRYAIGIQFLDRNAVIMTSTHRVSAQAELTRIFPDSLPEYAFGPALRAWFNPRGMTVAATDLDLTTSLHIFPNPVDDQFFIDLAPDLLVKMGSSNGLKLRLFNMAGQEVHSQWLNAGTNRISVAQLPTGSYVWQLVGNNRHRAVGQIVLK